MKLFVSGEEGSVIVIVNSYICKRMVRDVTSDLAWSMDVLHCGADLVKKDPDSSCPQLDNL